MTQVYVCPLCPGGLLFVSKDKAQAQKGSRAKELEGEKAVPGSRPGTAFQPRVFPLRTGGPLPQTLRRCFASPLEGNCILTPRPPPFCRNLRVVSFGIMAFKKGFSWNHGLLGSQTLATFIIYPLESHLDLGPNCVLHTPSHGQGPPLPLCSTCPIARWC